MCLDGGCAIEMRTYCDVVDDVFLDNWAAWRHCANIIIYSYNGE